LIYYQSIRDYIDAQCAAQGCKAGRVIVQIAEKSGMSKQAIRLYYNGMRVGTSNSATKIAAAINRIGGPGRVKPLTLMGLK
jgi:hypothetical protein